MLRVLIVDDEAPAREKLRRMLAFELDAQIVGDASNGTEAVEMVMSERPDLMLLDVQMPSMDGFEVVAAIPPAMLPRTVFITAHHQHAVKAFEVRAIDYLLKPVTPSRFTAMMARVREELSRGVPDAGLLSRIQDVARSLSAEPRYLRRVLVEGETKAFFVSLDHVDWIEVHGNYLELHTTNAVHLERGTLGEFMDRLDPAQFLRISRSHAVRLDAVQELHPWSHGDYHVLMKNGKTLTWSRRYRAVNASAFKAR